MTADPLAGLAAEERDDLVSALLRARDDLSVSMEDEPGMNYEAEDMPELHELDARWAALIVRLDTLRVQGADR